MMGRAMVMGWLGCYSKSCIQSPFFALSSAPIQVLAVISWKTSTTKAAANPTPERIFARPSPASWSSSSSACIVAIWDGEEKDVPSGAVGAWSCIVAFGKTMVGGAPAPPGLIAPVGAEVAKRMVGAGDIVGAPAARRGMVGAGAGGRGGPPVGVGGAPGTGGLTGGAIDTVADGTEGGASAAFKVTRTVSFLRGTLDVCLLRGMLPVCLDGAGGWLSFSLMHSQGFVTFGTE